MIADLKPYSSYRVAEGGWIGEIPSHWTVRRMKYVVREVDSRSTTGKEQLLRISQYTGVTQRRRADGLEEPDTRADSLVGYKRVEPNDLVINIMLAWNGSMGVSRYTGIASPAYCVYRFSGNAHPWYMHNLLRSPAYKARIKASSTGVVESRLRLYSDDLGRIEALLPPPDEQAAIVRFLDWANGRLERAIRAKRKVIALLGEQKQVIIHRAVTRGLDPSVPLKLSGIPWLGEIPRHWEVRKLKYEMSFRGGGTPSKGNSAYWNGTIPWVSPKDMKSEVIHDAEDHITERAVAESSTNLVPAGSLLMVVRSGILQRAIPVARCIREVTLNQDMKALTSKGRLDLDYFVLFIRGCEKHLLRVWTKQGATVESVEHQYLANTKVPIPPLPEQQHIVERLASETAPQTTATSRLNREIALLREYRTRLVADVVTGKLDVREAAASLPDAADQPDALDDCEALFEGDEDNADGDHDAAPEETEA